MVKAVMNCAERALLILKERALSMHDVRASTRKKSQYHSFEVVDSMRTYGIKDLQACREAMMRLSKSGVPVDYITPRLVREIADGIVSRTRDRCRELGVCY